MLFRKYTLNSDTVCCQCVFTACVKTIVRKEQYKGDTADNTIQKNSIVSFLSDLIFLATPLLFSLVFLPNTLCFEYSRYPSNLDYTDSNKYDCQKYLIQCLYRL